MQETKTASSGVKGNDILPTTNEELSEGERNVVNHLASVSAQSTKFDGMCGRVTNVQFDEEVEEPEELKQAIQQLSKDTDVAQEQIVDTQVANNISKVQDELREMVGLKPDESRDIIVTVQLPDGRTFNERFDAPTFDAESYENRFQTLYSEILGLDEIRQQGIEGEVVPVREVETRNKTNGAKYEIDFSYADKSSSSFGPNTSVTGKVSSTLGSENIPPILVMIVLVYGTIGLLVVASESGVL